MAQHAIFIGYRRDDTADVAGRIYDALARRFGRGRVFKDVDNIRPGADFGEYIQTILPKCRVFLALIGPGWIGVRDESGQRRLDDPNDWVRIELETALAARGLDVVPVLVNGAQMPRAEDLPESLRPLLRRHAAAIRRDPDFHDDVRRLAGALQASVKSGVIDLRPLGGARDAAEAERGGGARAWLIGAAAVLALAVAGYGIWRVLPSPLAADIPSVTEPETAAPPATSPANEEASAGLPPPSTAAAAGPRDRQPFRDCDVCPEMVAVPAGSFVMGSPPSEVERQPHEGPQRQVSIRRFAVGRFEVTFGEWERCVAAGACAAAGADPRFQRSAQYPVILVSWQDAQRYVRWLSQETGRRYRLPSEAEWEYVARAGSSSPYWWGSAADHAHANFGAEVCCAGEAAGRDQWVFTAPVGSFPPNAFGLYDVQGNVFEMVEDCYSASYAGLPTNGSAYMAPSCDTRPNRGGAWADSPSTLRIAFRRHYAPSFQGTDIGFRVARDL